MDHAMLLSIECDQGNSVYRGRRTGKNKAGPGPQHIEYDSNGSSGRIGTCKSGQKLVHEKARFCLRRNKALWEVVAQHSCEWNCTFVCHL